MRSPGIKPDRMVSDLGLPARAVAALSRAGVTHIDDLALLTRRELAAIAGLGAGMVAAIRKVVPEPPMGAARSAAPDADEETAVARPDPGPEPAQTEWPPAPAIPSFQSLRAPGRGTALDLLVGESPPPPPPAPAGIARAEAPRPPEWADLLLLAGHVGRAVFGAPWRVARWSVRQPLDCVRRLLGEQGQAPRRST